MSRRTLWFAPDLGIEDEPLFKALLKYRQDNRRRVQIPRKNPVQQRVLDAPNLISSRTESGRQKPIIDMDFAHHYEQSTSDGHSHLYIDVEMSGFKWFVLMSALYFAGVIELGFYAWSLRRRANFVRLPGVTKSDPAEFTKPTYGWFRKLK